MIVLIVVSMLLVQFIKVEQLNLMEVYMTIGNDLGWTQHQASGNNENKNTEKDYSSHRKEAEEGEKEELVDEEEEDEDQDSTTSMFSHSITTRIRINSPIFERQNMIMRHPTQDNTVIAFIAMGPHHTLLLHRAIRSIRTSGEFNGYIMIMTDRSGWEYFSWSLDRSDSKVILIQGHDHHLTATHAAPASSLKRGTNNSGKVNITTTPGRPFKHPTMVYKRFKTHLLEYIAEHDVLNREMEYCLYLDIDNVIFHPIQRLLNEYYVEFATTYNQIIEKDANRLMTHYHDYVNNTGSTTGSNETTTMTSIPIIEYGHPKPRLQFISMWKDIRPQAKLWQTGQILYHRQYSQGCLDIWRAEIDSYDNYGEYMEQPLFVKALQHQYHDLSLTVPPPSIHDRNNHHHKDINQSNGDSPKLLCHIVELPDQPRHFNMARKEIVSGPKNDVPTILHFSSMRVNENGAQEQRDSFVQALQLRYKTIRFNRTVSMKVAVSQENGSKHLVSRNNTLIPWDTVITPMSTYGRGKSNK
jgi:hypothetical protein